MLPLLLSLSLGATPKTLVLMPFQTAQVSKELSSFSAEHLAQVLNTRGFEVLTPQAVSSMLNLERQKQLLGCSEGAKSCLAELAGALGADAVLTGTMARLGQTFQIDVKILNALDGKSLALAHASARNEEDLVAALDEAATALVNQVNPVATVAPAPSVTSSERALGAAFWGPVIGGGAVAIAGGVTLGLAVSSVERLKSAPGDGEDPLSVSEAQRQLQTAGTLRTVGVVGLGVGVAAVLAGVIFGRPAEAAQTSVSVSLVPTHEGAMVGVSGALP